MWYDFYTGKEINGGQTIEVPAPYERMPLYVRSGSIVPFGPAMQWSDEKPAEEINLYVYALSTRMKTLTTIMKRGNMP